MFFDKDEDEQDFSSPSGGSKLASLFGMDVATTKGGNESLTYTAPKQPRKESTGSAPPGATPDLTMVCVVQTYKYVDNEYKHQGKLGAAILSNHSTSDYRILLYVSKQKQVTNVQISKNFLFTMQPNNYATFYDVSRQGWSIMFESLQIAQKFGKEVAVAKANTCAGSLDSVIIQDLEPGDGGSLEAGDSAEVKYSGWLLTNRKLGQMFDSNVNSEKQFRFKLGKGKVIKGWETGIVGMKKGGRRVLIVPPSLAYAEQGMGDKVPPNSTLIFEIEMTRVKLARGDSTATTPEQSSAEAIAPPSQATGDSTNSKDTDGAPTEEMVKSRSRSINDQMAQSPKSDKARLISRMAKMGQPMLPMVGAIPATATDSEEEIPVSSSPDGDVVPPTKMETPRKPSVPSAGNLQTNVNTASAVPTHSAAYSLGHPATQQLAIYQNSLVPPQQSAMSTGMHPHMSPVHPMAPFQTTPPQPMYNQPYPPQTYGAPMSSADVHVPVILSESRQHSAEMRLAMSTVSEKVDKLLNKLENSGVAGYLGSSPSMETSVLMQNIQRIVQENERLKKELSESGIKVETQNCKIAELLQQNQKYVEQSHSLLEQRNDSFRNTTELSQSKVLALEQEKAKLATELSLATATVSTLQLEINQIRKIEGDLRHKLEDSSHDSKSIQNQIDKLQKQHEEDQEQVKEMTDSYKEEKQQRKNLTHKMNQLNEEIADLKITNETLEKNVNDRKKKALEERRKFEEEIDEIRIQSEADIQALRKKMYSQKTTTSSEQILQNEEELRKELEEKNERMLSSVQEKHNRALQTVEEEKSVLEKMVQDLQTKLQNSKSQATENDENKAELQEQIEELKGWQEKYEKLRNQSLTMKSKYDDRIEELENELEETTTKMESLQQSRPLAAASGASADLTAEVKKIMNAVFQTSRSEFSKDETYSGSEIIATLLQIIKSTTLSLVQQPESVSRGDSGDGEKEEEKGAKNEGKNQNDEDQTQTPETVPSEEADNIPAENVLVTRSNPKESSPETDSGEAAANLEISDGQVQNNVVDDGNRDDKKETLESVEINRESPPPMEQPLSSDEAETKVLESDNKHQPQTPDVIASLPSDGTAATESKVPVSSNSPIIPTSNDEPKAEDFFPSELPPEDDGKIVLSREDSFDDLRPQAPPPLFGSDDDDFDDQDLFG